MSFLGSSPSVAYVSFSVKPQTRAWPPRPLSPPSVFFFPLVMGLKPLASLHLAFSASCSFSTQNAAPWAPRLSCISYLLLCDESVQASRLRATHSLCVGNLGTGSWVAPLRVSHRLQGLGCRHLKAQRGKGLLPSSFTWLPWLLAGLCSSQLVG